MVDRHTLDPGNLVDGKSNPVIYDDRAEAPQWRGSDQHFDPTGHVGDEISEAETASVNMTDADGQDHVVDPADGGFRNGGSALTDAGSGMQVDSAVSWGPNL
jgi:hypothetical protein